MTYKVFGKPNCAGCDQAKALLTAKEVTFEYVDITRDAPAMQMFRDYGYRSVPKIFHDTTHIGSFAELQTLLS